MAEMQAQRDAQWLAKLREVQEMDAAVEAAYEAECQEHQQQRAAQQRQWAFYRQQQEEAEAARRAAAAAAAREIELERADIAAAEAEAVAAAAARAAAERAKLEAFKAASAAAVQAKRLAAVEAKERERQYIEECKQVGSLNSCWRHTSSEPCKCTLCRSPGKTGVCSHLSRPCVFKHTQCSQYQARKANHSYRLC
jgi:hypothetical protein